MGFTFLALKGQDCNEIAPILLSFNCINTMYSSNPCSPRLQTVGMSKRRVSFGGVTVVGPGDGKNLPDQTESSPSASQDHEKPAKMRKNNKIIENSDFNFGTADQRAETQNFVNEKVFANHSQKLSRKPSNRKYL